MFQDRENPRPRPLPRYKLSISVRYGDNASPYTFNHHANDYEAGRIIRFVHDELCGCGSFRGHLFTSIPKEDSGLDNHAGRTVSDNTEYTGIELGPNARGCPSHPQGRCLREGCYISGLCELFLRETNGSQESKRRNIGDTIKALLK